MSPIRIGRRRSELAKAQSSLVMQSLPRQTFTETDIITTGDCITDRPLSDIGGKALFCKEIDAALRDKRIDWAVHSLKDVESDLSDDLTIAAVLPAAPCHDVMLLLDNSINSIDNLPLNAVIGTCSNRRAGHLLCKRPDLQLKMLRGNVPTRINALDNGDFDGIVLAQAGLQRLSIQHHHINLPIEMMTPAVAQGVIGIVILKENLSRWRDLFDYVNHAKTMQRIIIERKLLSHLNATCFTPIGVYFTNNQLHISIVHPKQSLRWYKIYAVNNTDDIPAIVNDIKYNVPEELLRVIINVIST